jgi:hypothetical protein
MLATILFAGWAFIGMIAIGLARIKTPQDSIYGKENPEEAWIAWTLMLLSWPLTLLKRKEFARYGDPRDEHNPSWLAEGRKLLADD